MTITLNGLQVTELGAWVPLYGDWRFSAKVSEAVTLEGPAELVWGAWVLAGFYSPGEGGRFREETIAQVVGQPAWRTSLPSKTYANDAGLTASAIASDVAVRVGSTITVQPEAERVFDELVTTDEDAVASTILSNILPAGRWWVELNGQTIAGDRLAPPLDPLLVTVLDYDPHSGVALLDADDPSPVIVGGILPQDDRLTEARRVVELRAGVSSAGGRRISVQTEPE